MHDALLLALEWRWAVLAGLWLAWILGLAMWYRRHRARERAARLRRLDEQRLQTTLNQVSAMHRVNRTRYLQSGDAPLPHPEPDDEVPQPDPGPGTSRVSGRAARE